MMLVNPPASALLSPPRRPSPTPPVWVGRRLRILITPGLSPSLIITMHFLCLLLHLTQEILRTLRVLCRIC